MGIFSIFLLPLIVFLAVMIYKVLQKNGMSFSKRVGITFLFLFPFTYDILITNLLSGYYCLIAPPHPKTKIIKKVKYPISIYWEDNVYPGFSKEDRELMIMNYLDGVHLKMMALNGDDGKIYVYRAKEGEYKAMGYKERDYAKAILKRGKTYTKQSMPKTNYTVTFNEIKLNPFARHFLYSDETKVIENNTSKVIAYNRRYIRFFYNISPDVALGNIYYYPHAMCGESYDGFDYEVFQYVFNHGGSYSDQKHKIDLNRYLYNKYIKGGK
ncbi:MAG: hypothetical protein GXO12_04615 [Epsilonproteobacteria bacterium]|nr:hypothetical protein [Campylobacterota bacterium]